MPGRKYLTRGEINDLMNASLTGVYPERDRCLIELCFRHGLRVSELINLQTIDISIADRKIYIQRLKNGFSTIQPLIEEEVKILQRWLDCRSSWKNAQSPLLFLSRTGKPLARQQIHTLIRRYGERAGIVVPVHPHMLRHACGYALADLGTDTRLIQDYLGHRNIRHTVIYTASNAERFNGIWTTKKVKNIPNWPKLEPSVNYHHRVSTL